MSYKVMVAHGQGGVKNHYSHGEFDTLAEAVAEAQAQPEEHGGWYALVYVEDDEGNCVYVRD